MRATTNLFAIVMALASASSLGQGTIEVISLRHRTAEQVIPVLQPLLAPGGALSGQYNQLIVRTSPENLAQIRQVLDQQAVSTVRGRLGDWIELGGASSVTARSVSGIGSSRESAATQRRRIWARVEEIR